MPSLLYSYLCLTVSKKKIQKIIISVLNLSLAIKCASEDLCEVAWGRKGEERFLHVLGSNFDFVYHSQALSSFCVLKGIQFWKSLHLVCHKVYGVPMIKSIISKLGVSKNIAIYLRPYLLLCRKGDRCHQTCYPLMAYFDAISLT